MPPTQLEKLEALHKAVQGCGFEFTSDSPVGKAMAALEPEPVDPAMEAARKFLRAKDTGCCTVRSLRESLAAFWRSAQREHHAKIMTLLEAWGISQELSQKIASLAPKEPTP